MEMEDQLTPEERSILLKLARQALESIVCGSPFVLQGLDTLPPHLQAPGASFVTLSKHGQLRGCIGSLEPYLPLAEDVCEHTVAAGTQDYRFPPVQPEELREIVIEISRLTLPRQIIYDCAEDLLVMIHPGVDGVVICDGLQRATFLPQVWKKLPDPELFLGNLCHKLGASPELWRYKKVEVFTYQVEEFQE